MPKSKFLDNYEILDIESMTDYVDEFKFNLFKLMIEIRTFIQEDTFPKIRQNTFRTSRYHYNKVLDNIERLTNLLHVIEQSI